MTLSKTVINSLRDYISRELEERSFEDILEDYDLTPEEAFINLFTNGLIDPELLEHRAGQA